MANTPRAGRQGTVLLLALQGAYGTRIQDAAKFIKLNFAPTTLRFDPTGEQARSATIVQGGADSLNVPGILSGAMRWEGELLPQILPYLLVGQFNPTTPPVSAAVPVTTILADAAKAANTNIITDTAVKTPAAQGGDPAFPAKVKLTLGSQASFAGSLIVEGFRKRTRSNESLLRRKVKETVAVASGDTEIETKAHFIEVTSVIMTEEVPSGSKLEFIPDTYKTQVVLNLTANQFTGFSAAYSKGGVPGCGFDLIPNTAEFRFQNEMRFAIDAIAGLVFPQTMVDDPTLEAYAFPTSGDFALSNFPDPELAFQPSWGRALMIGNDTEPTPVNGVTVRVNNNYGPPEGAVGDRFAGQPIVTGDGFRQTTCEIDTPFISGAAESDTFKRWHDFYLDNVTESLKMQTYNFLDNGRQIIIQVDMPRFQLTDFPNVDVDGAAGIDRRLVGKCVKSEDSSVPDEISVTIWSKDQYTVPS